MMYTEIKVVCLFNRAVLNIKEWWSTNTVYLSYLNLMIGVWKCKWVSAQTRSRNFYSKRTHEPIRLRLPTSTPTLEFNPLRSRPRLKNWKKYNSNFQRPPSFSFWTLPTPTQTPKSKKIPLFRIWLRRWNLFDSDSESKTGIKYDADSRLQLWPLNLLGSDSESKIAKNMAPKREIRLRKQNIFDSDSDSKVKKLPFLPFLTPTLAPIWPTLRLRLRNRKKLLLLTPIPDPKFASQF